MAAEKVAPTYFIVIPGSTQNDEDLESTKAGYL